MWCLNTVPITRQFISWNINSLTPERKQNCICVFGTVLTFLCSITTKSLTSVFYKFMIDVSILLKWLFSRHPHPTIYFFSVLFVSYKRIGFLWLGRIDGIWFGASMVLYLYCKAQRLCYLKPRYLTWEVQYHRQDLRVLCLRIFSSAEFPGLLVYSVLFCCCCCRFSLSV